MITTWPVSVICALVLPDNNRFEQSAGSLAQRVFIGYRRGTWCGLPSQEESGLARALLGGSCCFASVGLGPDTLVTHRPRASALLVNTDPLNPPPTMLLLLISHAGFGNSCSISLSIDGATAISGHILRPVLPHLPACLSLERGNTVLHGR